MDPELLKMIKELASGSSRANDQIEIDKLRILSSIAKSLARIASRLEAINGT